MKKFIPLILFFFSFSLLSQTENEKNKNIGFITGKIIDFKTKQPIHYVNVVCKDKAKNIITGGITNNKGFFKIEKLPLDSIFIDIQFIGYKTITRKIILTQEKPKIALSIIYFEEDTNALNEVIIQSETTTIVQKIDRKVVNVGKDLASAGTNSLQLLENIPSVQVNFQTGSINLRGNDNVRVLVDGKPSNLTSSKLLKQIPASSVKSVELITNPSAKYNPEGMSGIINIILKKNTTIGFNGSFTIGAEHSKNTRPTSSLDLNYRAGKINVYANYALDLGDFETFASFNRSDKDLIQNIDYLDNSTSNYLKTGIDFYINNKNTLSFYTSQSFSDTDFSVNTSVFENSNLIFNALNFSQFDTKEQTYNTDYKINIDDKGQQIELELTYTETKEPQSDFNKEIVNPNSKIYNYTNKTTNNQSLFLANLDYTKPMSGGTLELGFEARIQNTFNRINTDQKIEVIGASSTTAKGNSTFNYDRNIYSAYINYSKEYKKITFQAGLRFEDFKVKGLFSNTEKMATEAYTDNIFSIYPSAFLTYYASDKNEFQIGYSKRVDRPGIEQVSPIQEWVSPLAVTLGNRTLEPQFTNSFELNYTKNISKGYFSFGVFFRNTKNLIGRVLNEDDINPDKQILSYTNYDNANSFGFEFSSSFKIYNWWTVRPSSNLYVQDNNGIINGINESIKNTLFSARVSNSFKASKKLSFQLSSSYRGKSQSVQFKINPYFILNAAAQLSVLDGNGSLSLRGTDIFDNYKLAFSSTNPFQQTGSFTLEYSSIYLGFSYDFGSGKNRARERKEREARETQGSGGVL